MHRTLLLLSFVLATAATAQQDELGLHDLTTARTMAMGGAFRVSGLSADAVDGNPAAMTLYPLYQVDLNGGWDSSTKAAYAGSDLRDSSDSVAAGVSYHYLSTGHSPDRQGASVTTLGIALPITENLSVGVSGHYLLRHGDAPANAVTGDVGLVARLSEGFSVGVAAHNLINTHHPDLARYYDAGMSLLSGPINFVFDARSELSGRFRPILNTGLEFVLGQSFPIRGGYSVDTATGTHYLSGGVGYVSQGSGVDLSYRRELHGPSNLLVLSLKAQF